MTRIWLISLSLIALGQRPARRPRPFTVAELLSWAPGLKQMRTAHRACNMLARAGLLDAAPPPADNPGANQNPSRPAAWRLTAVGIEAARVAQSAAASRKRAETMATVNRRRVYEQSVPHRLWTVLRARRALTSLEAVELLGDAGESTDALGKQVRALLAAWHILLPGTVQVAARKVGRCRRYVLQGDVGRFPPDVLRNAENRARALLKTATSSKVAQ